MGTNIDQIEKCVNCGDVTPYQMSESIFSRLYYIEGAGQLCKPCYNKIFP